ncbi:hypothetical protein amrb99_62100 [Actinomadura sp. RB99]|uniref:helix-turn-helix domain-containing protein n=1 Tax=Actinomadura sp. RB99 TaxID=2691577 RepID=UPI001686DA5D|nr:helix-turn-helix domain-containing protein [Actinomadura sp. RB99]MBD2897251.1 hypothetical protein [Actinomadura sp. RB99]
MDEAGTTQAGPVVVPASLCGPLLAYLTRALTRDVRDGGARIPPDLVAFLRALHNATEPAPLADHGNNGEAPETIEGTGWSTVAQLAAYSGHPPRTLRHWAAAGRVRARRVGRTWLIDPDSLKEDTAP